MKKKRLLATILCTMMLVGFLPAQSAVVLAEGVAYSATVGSVEATGQGAEPVDPTDPTSPTKPTKPTVPTISTEPTAPTDATVTTDITTDPSDELSDELEGTMDASAVPTTEAQATVDPVTPPATEDPVTETPKPTEEVKQPEDPTKETATDPTEPSVTGEPTEGTATTEPTESLSEEPTSEEVTSEEPTSEETTTPEIEAEEITINISVSPVVANLGDTITLTATVTGPAGMAYQWQWASISDNEAERIAESERQSASSEGAKNELQAQDGRSWRDESGATGLSHSFEATEETLNRYWRLKVWVPEAEVAGNTGLSSLRDFFFSSAKADGSYQYSGGVPVVIGTTDATISAYTKLTISPANLSLQVGTSGNLTIKSEPTGITSSDYEWVISEGSNVVSIDANGKVTGLAAGTAKITAKSGDAACNTVTVTVSSVAVQSIKLASGSETTVDVGDWIDWDVVFSPSNATNKGITYTASPAGVVDFAPASGSDSGRVSIMGKDLGSKSSATATITINSAENPKLYIRQSVTVKQLATGITVETVPSTLPFEAAVGKTLQLKAVITPSNVANKSVTWSSSNEAVATVSSSGLVRGVSSGTATITATPVDGGTAEPYSVTITVNPVASRVILMHNGSQVNETTIGLEQGQSLDLTGSYVFPEGASQNLTWTSSSTQIATVSNGVVKAGNRNGVVTITATTTDGSNLRATVRVNVAVLAKEVRITGDTEVAATKTIRLTAEALSGGSKTGVAQTFTWESSNPNIATVSTSGSTVTVTGKSVSTRQTVNIKATATDGSGKSSEIVITVIPITNSIAIKKDGTTITTYSLGIGGTGESQIDVQAVVSPDASMDNVEWTTTSKAIATVVGSGRNATIKAVGKGTATITAKALDGSNKAATVRVTVSTLVTQLNIKDASGNIVANSNGTDVGMDIAAGKTARLTAEVVPSGASNKTIKWTSSNTDVATVSGGMVSVKNVSSNSTVRITAESSDGSDISATVTIHVKPAATRVTVWKRGTSEMVTEIGLEQGGVYSLEARVEPQDAAQNVVWRSTNTQVAEVDSTGKVTAGARNGTATITATSSDGSNRSASVRVTVAQLVKGVSIYYKGVEVYEDDPIRVAAGKSIQLTGTGVPSSATNTRVTWSSSNTNVATVSANGMVTARNVEKNASTFITATAADGSIGPDGRVYSKTIEVVVQPAATKVTIVDGNTQEILTEVLVDEKDKGTTMNLKAVISPDDAAQDVTWKTSNVNVVSVSSNGVVTFGTKGTATITATTADGTNRSGSIRVTVTALAGSVNIKEKLGDDNKVLTVAMGKSIKLTAEVLPTSTANRNVVWTSSDPDVASVSSAGMVTGKREGQTIIRATSADSANKSEGEKVYDEVKVNVVPVATRVAIKHGDSYISSYFIDLSGDYSSISNRLELTAEVLPNTAGQGVTWRSSSTSIAEVVAQNDEINTVYIYPVRAGTTTITATSTDGTNRMATLTLTVGYKTNSIVINGDSNISVGSDGTNMIAGGKTARFTASVMPANTTNKTVKWTIDEGVNSNVASISSAGMLTVNKVDGEVSIVIRATATDGSGLDATFPLTITPATSKIAFTVNDSTTETRSAVIDYATEPRTATIHAKITPKAANQSVTWTSSAPAIVQIIGESFDADGYPTCTVKGLKAGTARITATSADGTKVSSYIDVKVSALVSGLVAHDYKDIMTVGEKQTLTVGVYPVELEANKDVKWTSDTPSVATVNSVSGLVTAVRPGTVVITATAKDAAEGVAPVTFPITIEAKTTGLSILENGSIVTNKNLTMVVGEYKGFDYAPIPSTAAATVTWKSSNPGVVKVLDSQFGSVEAVGAGTAYITATSVENPAISARVQITIAKEPDPTVPTKVTIEANGASIGSNRTVTVKVGQGGVSLSAIIDPPTASGDTFLWATSASNVVGISATSGSDTSLEFKRTGTAVITLEARPGYFRDKITVVVEN